MSSELKNSIIPECFTIINNEVGNLHNEPSIDDMYRALNLKSISFSSSYRWITELGFIYNEQKQCYYIDGHDREDVVENRNVLIKKYFKLELECYRWVQILKSIAEQLENEETNLPKNCSYQYVDSQGNEMREYHVDTNNVLENYIHPNNQKYGGNRLF